MIRVPSGSRYWSVLDDELQVHPVADRFLREMRFGKDRAESTTKAYASGVALFLRWCGCTGRDWQEAAPFMGLFILWLRHTPADGRQIATGPGANPARGNSRINKVLVAVRGFLSFAVLHREAPAWVLTVIYDVGDERDLPAEVQHENAKLTHRMRAQHHLHEPETAIDRAADEEIVALTVACRSARDRLIVLLLSRAGLRVGEMTGLRRSDLHLLPNNGAFGCAIEGAHLHVVRRPNINGAWAKSRRDRTVPLDFLVVWAIDLYLLERQECPAAAVSDYLLVNLFRAPLGSPVTPGAVNELFSALCTRAGLSRAIAPHMCRHAFGSNLADAGALLDEIQDLLGHRSPESSRPYLHPSAARMRDAVDRVPVPRSLTEGAGR
ncbi:tyrosine-type recombinase/integrase [Amycolatopsis sp. WAC 01375]|uniref:tyrosine-type recombinase/integrase n=1 Tax=Amycolatopsis sp. WAC 01375 TaxID=2203194 RepID=UPI0018F69AFD|nr:tyrosine-type recombinase/integrase [Amycolatopsis sp. WAC 01375]